MRTYTTLSMMAAAAIGILGAPVQAANGPDRDQPSELERDDRDRTARRAARRERTDTPYSNRSMRRLREAKRIARELERDRKPKCWRCRPPRD
jgi:hypothetical protein